MLRPCIRYPNARLAAHAVLQQLTAEGRRPVSPRPWNMYEPDTTFWWLVPSTDWPAYKHGKLFFSPDRAPAGHLFCGLHVEKGLDPTVGAAYPSPAGQRLLMKKDWTWFRFLADLESDAVGTAAANCGKSTGSAISLRLEAQFVSKPQAFDPYDPDAPRVQMDIVVFDISGSALRATTSETPANLLAHAANGGNTMELATCLRTMADDKWVWLDVFLGVVFATPSVAASPDVWDSAQLWTNALKVWSAWFV